MKRLIKKRLIKASPELEDILNDCKNGRNELIVQDSEVHQCIDALTGKFDNCILVMILSPDGEELFEGPVSVEDVKELGW